MARDFPEEKYDFRLQKAERTFAENLLHVAAVATTSSAELREPK